MDLGKEFKKAQKDESLVKEKLTEHRNFLELLEESKVITKEQQDQINLKINDSLRNNLNKFELLNKQFNLIYSQFRAHKRNHANEGDQFKEQNEKNFKGESLLLERKSSKILKAFQAETNEIIVSLMKIFVKKSVPGNSS